MTKQVYDCFVVLVNGTQDGPAFRSKEDAQLWADDAVYYRENATSVEVTIKQRHCAPLDMAMARRLEACALRLGDTAAAHYYSTLTQAEIERDGVAMSACLPSDYEIDSAGRGQ